ncbi:hypothetical protein AX15_003229 [Amanita polypyramis BW_CC]|nr:hypothetical protein AX15_003229 [Amanita polypyramis BW_CC]
MLITIAVVFIAALVGIYQFHLKPLLAVVGYNRKPDSIGNTNCDSVPQLQACEKLVIHQPTGGVYLACSTPASRPFWIPAVGRLNEAAASRDDYVAIYDPNTAKVTRLELSKFDNSRGLSVHGMDVVPDTADPNHLFVYLINHRAPPNGQSAKVVGADSAVEIFETSVGGAVLSHIKTVEHSTIITPNDVVGYGDGKSFYVTNDHGEKTGILRELELFGRASSSVVYCHTETGCKYATKGIQGSNGIAKAENGTIYVANSKGGGVYVLERQSDNSLVLSEYIKTDRLLDNISIDTNGAIWAAGFTNALTLAYQHFANPSIPSPSSALRVTINTGPNAFYGEKYQIDKVFEDDGSLASGITSAAYDAERRRLFLHGIAAPQLVICNVS